VSLPVDPCLAVIPARGGSKGLPGKNIRPLAGIPLLGHSLRCAAMCSRIARTVVSTDSREIARTAGDLGGVVPFLRPPELARDDTPMMPVLAHALREMEEREGREFATLLLLDPTSPGRIPKDIEGALELLAEDPAAMGVVACSRPTFNPFWVGVVDVNGYMAPAFPDASKYERRQDVPPFFRINGALYLWRREFVLRDSPRWTEAPHRLLEIPESRAFSIDDLYEFQLASLQLAHGLITLPWLEEQT
jgi:CMP-N,N'-diacetyllegionaminic acid synthase